MGFNSDQKMNSGSHGASKNPDRVIRKVDFASGSRYKIKQKLNNLEINAKVREKNSGGKFENVKIKKRKLSDLIKNSNLINTTERRAQARLEKGRGFIYEDKDGKKYEYKVSGSSSINQKRKNIAKALIGEEKPEDEGLSPEQIKANVRMSRASQSMGKKTSVERSRDKKDIKKRFEESDSSRIGAKQAEYKVGVGGPKMSEGDARGGGTGQAGSGFADKSKESAASIAGGIGANKNAGKSEDNDTMPMFRQFGR